MKARLVENIDFKRGIGSKAALDIGGFIPDEVFEEFYEEAYYKWKIFVESLVGKKITFVGSSHKNRGNWKEHEIIVKKVDARFSHAEFSVMGQNNDWYKVHSEDKIHIE